VQSLTINKIPEDIINKIVALSKLEKRSLNKEIIVLLEKGIKSHSILQGKMITKDVQIQIWKSIAGAWQDKRTTKEIIKDIYEQRSMGRDIVI
jgi:hypothetical protein